VHMDNSMRHNWRKIQEYFAWKKDDENSPSRLLPRFLTMWLPVLRLCKGKNERSNNHGRERPGRQIDRRLVEHKWRPSSISVLWMDGKIGVGSGTRWRILYQYMPTKQESYLRFSG
jgi:hypothetical protein